MIYRRFPALKRRVTSIELLSHCASLDQIIEFYGIVVVMIRAVYLLTELPIDRNGYLDLGYHGNDLVLCWLLTRSIYLWILGPRYTLFRNLPDEQLEINYSLPVLQVFKAAARYMVRGSKVLQLLWQAGNWECLFNEGTHLLSTEIPS
jgi:hypothetical protein